MTDNEKDATRFEAPESAGLCDRTSAERCRSGESGFTLVELFVVIVIMCALFVLFLPTVNTLKDRAKVARAMEEIRGIERDIAAYTTERATLPVSLADVNHDGMLDPWGHPYVYTPSAAPDADHPRRIFVTEYLCDDFDLYSKGADGDSAASIDESRSRDDVVRAGNGTFVGLVARLNDF